MKRKYIKYLSLIALLSLAGCAGGKSSFKTSTASSGENGTSSIISGNTNTVTSVSNDTSSHSYSLVSSSADSLNGEYTFICADCQKEATVKITCESGTPSSYTIDENEIVFSGISEDSSYSIEGEYHGSVIVDVTENYKFTLDLKGIDIYATKESPLIVNSASKFNLSANKDSENNFFDNRDAVTSEDDISAAVYTLCDTDLQGKGTLNVTSLNNNGIHCKDDLDVKNMTLQVISVDNSLKGNDSVTIESGDITLVSKQGDTIKTSNSSVSEKLKQKGNITLSGGNVTCYAACDGLDAAYDVITNEDSSSLNLSIMTDKYSSYSEEITDSSSVGSTLYIKSGGNSSNKYSLLFSDGNGNTKWVNASTSAVSTSMGGSSYYSVSVPSGYSSFVLYVYSSSQTQGQSSSYAYKTDTMTLSSSYDTISVSNRGGSYSTSWTNYSTTQQGPGGGGGGMGGGGMQDGNTDKGDHSTKGIKANNEIIISGGTISVNAYDDAIHANNDETLENGDSPLGNVTINGGTLSLASNDDGIHADNALTINGGTISVTRSYEGLEGLNIYFKGGYTSVVSSDDGVNASTTSGEGIVITGGEMFVVAGGDGLDSNSTTSYSGIVFNGGKTIVFNSSSGNSVIDTENGYKYTSGYVCAFGISGGMTSESSNCSPSVSSVGKSGSLSLTKDNYITVSGLCTFKSPLTMSSAYVILGNTSASVSSSSSCSVSLNSFGYYWSI